MATIDPKLDYPDYLSDYQSDYQRCDESICTHLGDEKLPFFLHKTIGISDNSRVHEGLFRIDGAIKPVAIKKTHEKFKNNIIMEATILKKYPHKNIPIFYGLYHKDHYYYLIMELIKGSPMDTYIDQPRDHSIKKNLFIQLINVIQFLHNNNIVHLDIKLENVMIEQHTNRVVLIDYGYSTTVTEHQMVTVYCGSPFYAAPEIWYETPYNGKLADIWSLGILLITSIRSEFPYDPDTLNNVRLIHIEITNNRLKYDGVPEDLLQIIKQMLKINPIERIDINKLLIAFQNLDPVCQS